MAKKARPMPNLEKRCVVSLYLSPSLDADLILARSQLGGKVFARVAKESLRLMSRGGYKSAYIEKQRKKLDPTACKGRLKPVRTTIDFSNDRDIAVILMNVKQRKGCALIKAVLRFGLGSMFTVGCMLNGDSKLCEEFSDRGLFFLANVPQIAIVPSALPKTDASLEAKEEEVKAVPASAPAMPKMQLDTGGDFEDDDILSMLDNM